jgi:hypothetical protein
MAYQLFQLPKQLNISSSFTLSAGAKAYFFETGTSTPQDTYSDAGLTTPHAHPVVADAAGVLPAIYLDPTLEYDLTLNTSADVLIYSVEKINDQVFSGDLIGRALYPKTAAETAADVTIEDFSYPPLDARRYLSGSAYAAAIQSAIDAADEAGGGEVYLDPSITWALGTTTIQTNNGVWIVGTNYVFGGTVGTIVTYTGSGNAFESADRASARVWSGGFRQLKIKGNGKVASSCGIDCRRIDDFTFDNVWVTDFDIGLRFDGTGSGGYRNRVHGGGYTHNNTGIQVINAANEQRFYAAQINNNTDYGVDVQDGNSVSIIDCNLETNGVHVRTAEQNTRVLFGRMEAATVRPWETTADAEYFYISGVHYNSTNTAAPLDAGKFTRIDWDDGNAVRGYNMVRNGSFEHWSAGTSAAPDRWTLGGSTTIARDTDTQHGLYSALITAGATSASISQNIDLPLYWRDGRREFLVTARVKLGTSTQAALQALPQDGSGTTQGLTLNEIRATAGSGVVSTTAAGWHTLKLIVRPDSDATRIRVALLPDNSAGTGTAFFDAINVTPLGAGREEFYEAMGDFAPWMARVIKSSKTHDFGAGDGDTTTLTVTGAAVGDPVFVTASSSSAAANVRGFVSSADTVTLVKHGTGDPGSITYLVTVFLAT